MAFGKLRSISSCGAAHCSTFEISIKTLSPWSGGNTPRGYMHLMPQCLRTLKLIVLVFATRSLIYPDVDLPAQALLHNRPFLRLFTDGSCRHPTYPEAAHAGYAVVLDTSLSDASVPSLLATWQRTGQPPNELRVVHQGLVPGVQSINRAEVCAVYTSDFASRDGWALPRSRFGRTVHLL